MISLDRGEQRVLSWLAPESFLDGERWRTVLAPAFLAEGFRLAAVSIEYVRAKRTQSVLLGIRCGGTAADGRPAEVRGALYVAMGGVLGAESKARTLRLVPPSAGPTLVSFGSPSDPWCLYLAFPNDRAVRGLSAGADSLRLGNRLRGPAFDLASEGWRVRARSTVIELVRWKPGRRAVLRARLRLRHDGSDASGARTAYVRVYPIVAAPELARRWRFGAGSGDVTGSPELLGFDQERGLLLTAERPGVPWAVAGNDLAVWRAVGGTLQRLHARDAALLGGAGRSDVDDSDFARSVLRDLGVWAPALAARADALGRRLESMAATLRPAKNAPLHGDLGMGQILLDGARHSLIDWDESTIGDPHWDAASLVVDAERRGEPGPEEGAEDWAASVLGNTFDPTRWRWSHGVEHARRALATLQSGR
ncbi:MAG: phosphotransferase, partial [Candidatus Eisenbacteria bacterium]